MSGTERQNTLWLWRLPGSEAWLSSKEEPSASGSPEVEVLRILIGDELVMIPRTPTEPMMAAGLYHCSHDMEWADLYTAWQSMFDAVVQDGGMTKEAIGSEGFIE